MHANAKTRVAKIAKAIDAITKTANASKWMQMHANGCKCMQMLRSTHSNGAKAKDQQ